MKVILTAREDIKSKDGAEYVKASFLSVEDGRSGDIFTTREKYESLALSPSLYASREQIETLAENLPVVDVQFDQRGRVVSVR